MADAGFPPGLDDPGRLVRCGDVTLWASDLTWEAGDPAKAYDRTWYDYRAIAENFGTTGVGARMLAA